MSRTFECPGWIARSEGIEDEPSEWAILGTAAHAFAAHLLETGHPIHAYSDYIILSDILDNHWPNWLVKATPVTALTYKQPIRIEDDFYDSVDFYVNTCRSLKAPGDLSWVETKLDCRAYHQEVWGTGDFGRFRPSTGELVILDFKNGIRYAVSPENNPQLLCYALGACLMPELYGKVRSIWVGICQPRSLGEPLRWATIDPGWLYQWGYYMAERVNIAMSTSASALKAGAHCQYCPAFGVCEEAARNALQFYGEHSDNRPNSFSDPTTYDPPKLARALALVPYIEQWTKEVKRFANKEAEKGRITPGFKPIDRFGHTKWLDEMRVRAAAEDSGFADERIWNWKLKSPAQIKKLVGKETYEAQFQALTKRDKIGIKLVPEDDARPTAAPTIHLEFQARDIAQTGAD